MNNSLTARQRVARPIGVVLVWCEAVALLVFAALTVVDAVSGVGTGLGYAVGGTLLIFAVALALAGRSLWRGQRWARSYSIMWQVLQVASAFLLFSTSPVIAVAAIVVGLGAGVAVVLDAIEEMPDDA